MISNKKKLNQILTELFIRGRKLNISSLLKVVIKQFFFFAAPKDVRLTCTNFNVDHNGRDQKLHIFKHSWEKCHQHFHINDFN